MNRLDYNYIKGVAAAAGDIGLCKIANLDFVARKAGSYLTSSWTREKVADINPTPEELAQVAESGITESDIQAAAKVIQLVAEMKQQSDMSQAAAAGTPMPTAQGMMQPPMSSQPPLPPPPQPMNPMGMMPGGAPMNMAGM